MLHLHFRHPLRADLEAMVVRQPQQVLVACAADEVLLAWQQLQAWQAAGHWAAGFVAYEAAPAFATGAPVSARAGQTGLPLLWFALFRAEDIVAEPMPAAGAEADAFALGAWQPAQTQQQYTQAVDQIKEAIARGETYQVNYTLPFESAFSGSSAALYAAMRSAQQAPYAAHLQLGIGEEKGEEKGAPEILSASPELFFHWEGRAAGGGIITQPMKGTRARGLWSAQDAALAQELAASAKDRAENVMIVDLLRNDLGRVAQTGSVQVQDLFAVQAYPSVWQMTSRISARTRPEVDLLQIMQALFPCGSITGAPKRQTMGLIAALEPQPRGAYCGSVGLLRPDGSATFSVAIRTLTLGVEKEGKRMAQYHAGAGITWGSDAAAEWQETWDKTRVVQADFLQQRRQAFALIETLLWDGTGFAWLEGHVQRLAQSAAYFAFPFDRARWQAALVQAVAAGGAQRVRALLHADGRVEVSSTALPSALPTQPDAWLQPPKEDAPHEAAQSFVLAAAPITAGELAAPWLYHKTTQRQVYAQARQGQEQVFDTLLYNEAGQLCEFTIGNVVLQLDGAWYTPPIACGLLPGVLRGELLARGVLQERAVTVDDLTRAQAVWLINSVRGWVKMKKSAP